MHPSELRIRENTAGWIRKSARTSCVAWSESVGRTQPVVLREKAIFFPRLIIQSARCFIAVEQVPQCLCLRGENRYAVQFNRHVGVDGVDGIEESCEFR